MSLDRQKNELFNQDLSQAEIVHLLSKKKFRKIGQGFSAHVFGATDMSVVVKIFPPLNVGSPKEIESLLKNPVIRYAEALSSRWREFPPVKWIRQKAKLIVAMRQTAIDPNGRKYSSSMSIQGYKICIRKGLMKRLPTKVIPNCVSKLALGSISNSKLEDYLGKPTEIILQKRFEDKSLLINLLSVCAQKGHISKCEKLIQLAVSYQVALWRLGVADTDMSFNIFENLVLMEDGDLQIHDANDITDSASSATWFVREKEKDMTEIFREIQTSGYFERLSKLNLSGLSKTARKLYHVLPKQDRKELVMVFLNLSREILSEAFMTRNWNKSITTTE